MKDRADGDVCREIALDSRLRGNDRKVKDHDALLCQMDEAKLVMGIMANLCWFLCLAEVEVPVKVLVSFGRW